MTIFNMWKQVKSDAAYELFYSKLIIPSQIDFGFNDCTASDSNPILRIFTRLLEP